VDGRFEEFQTAEHDFSGNRVPGLAPHHVDGRILLERGGAYFELRGLYLDAIPTDDANQHQSGAYFLVDTRFGIDAWSAGALDLSPFMAVANVLDRRYNASVVVNAAGLRFFEPGPGRTFQAGLRVIWPQRAR
jgi:iron complex outermembrane receptor protein